MRKKQDRRPDEPEQRVPQAESGADPGSSLPVDPPDVGATQHLVRRAQDGQHPAWEKLSEKIEQRLRLRHGHRRVFPLGYDFDDFRMEVMVKVLQGIHAYQQQADGTFWNWLYCVAGNVLTDLQRKESSKRRGGDWRRLQPTTETDPVNQLPDRASESPTVLLRARELLDAEWECAKLLTNNQRDVYTLRRNGLTFAEIAAQPVAAGASDATLRSTYRRARLQVLECLSRKVDRQGRSFDDWRTLSGGD